MFIPTKCNSVGKLFWRARRHLQFEDPLESVGQAGLVLMFVVFTYSLLTWSYEVINVSVWKSIDNSSLLK